MRLRDFTSGDSDTICRINDSEIPNVPSCTPRDLQQLAEQSVYFRIAETDSGEVAGFLLALDESQWFKSRYPRFIYIDRVVVSAPFQSQGIGRLLYADVAALAAKRSPLLACEVNLRPANPRSLRFHEGLGFRQVGMQNTENGKKTVALMIKLT
jgi:uncharacterized protein